MKKALIAVLIVLSLLLAAAVGVVVYMETRPGDTPDGSTSESTPADTQSAPAGETTGPEETTRETVNISLPTENPDEVGPEFTWPENETGPQETAAPGDPDATWDPDENETPEMGV